MSERHDARDAEVPGKPAGDPYLSGPGPDAAGPGHGGRQPGPEDSRSSRLRALPARVPWPMVIGIALGVLIGLVLIAIFVFGFSQEAVDAPRLGN